MDELVLFGIIIVLLFLLIPLVTLIKVQLIQQNIRRIHEELKENNKQIQDLLSGVNPVPADRPRETVPAREDPVIVSPSVVETVFEPVMVDKPEPEVVPTSPEPPPVQEGTPISGPEVTVREIAEEPAATIKEEFAPDPIPVEKRRQQTKPPYKNPKEPSKRVNLLEKISFESLLPKIGIITLVLGVAFFVKYAIDQDWINEVGRVGIGMLAGAGLIGLAHILRKQYDVFSSLLAGGGIAVFYITITIAFREYQLFNAAVAFVFLIVTTIFSVLLSLLYDKKELAVISLLGGFASPLMVSTGSGNYIVLFSYIALLNMGLLAITIRKDWRLIGVISFWMTQLWVWLWLWRSFTVEYTGASVFIAVFFFQFYLLALIDYFRNPGKITPCQVFLILGNNLMLFAAYLFIFKDFTFRMQGVITILMACVNAVFMVILFRRKQIDHRLLYLLIAIVLGFVSLAVPLQLDGNAITLFWVAEMVILLMLWQKSRINVFRTGFVIISGLVIFSYLMDIEKGYLNSIETLPVILNRYFITGLGVLAGFFLSLKMVKRDTEYPMPGMGRFLERVLVGILFLVPFLELNCQIDTYVGWDVFRYVAMLTYAFCFMAGLAYYYRHVSAGSGRFFGVMLGAVVIYVVIYTYQVVNLRSVVYYGEELLPLYIAVHLLSLPAIGYLIYRMVKSVRSIGLGDPDRYIWIITLLSVIILTIETDHLAVMFFATPLLYDKVLYDVHTFVYPIVWGVIAMALMLWGLKRKELVLRKISLAFFAVIICKIYLYDVWRMSQGGRIISFVILGGILLVVSFMQQKIRTWVKNEAPPAIEEEKKDDSIS